MENFTPVSALFGGALIGLSAVLLLWLNGRVAGISSIMSGIFHTERTERYWRIVFLLGLIIGAVLFQYGWPEQVTQRQGYPLWLVATGGFLVGIGTRLGSGCTSGHGICGIAQWSLRSIAATCTFMTTGFITVYICKHLLGLY